MIAILCRELLISGLREGMAGRLTLPVNHLGKWKTTCQMIAIGLLLGGPALATFTNPEWINLEDREMMPMIYVIIFAGPISIWTAAVLSWLSAAIYLLAVSRQLWLPEE